MCVGGRGGVSRRRGGGLYGSDNVFVLRFP